jgi:hypothetical protein
MGRQIHGGLVRKTGEGERPLAIDGPPLSVMPAMEIDHPILGQLPEPEMEGNPGILQILPQPFGGFEQHVLNNITRINPPGNLLVESQADQLRQRSAVMFEQFIDSPIASGFGGFEQLLGVMLFGPHVAGL